MGRSARVGPPTTPAASRSPSNSRISRPKTPGRRRRRAMAMQLLAGDRIEPRGSPMTQAMARCPVSACGWREQTGTVGKRQPDQGGDDRQHGTPPAHYRPLAGNREPHIASALGLVSLVGPTSGRTPPEDGLRPHRLDPRSSKPAFPGRVANRAPALRSRRVCAACSASRPARHRPRHRRASPSPSRTSSPAPARRGAPGTMPPRAGRRARRLRPRRRTGRSWRAGGARADRSR